MNDWNLWLGSNETRTALKLIKEATEELKELISNGSHIQEKSIEKITLDYTYSLGQMIKDIESIVEEEKSGAD